MFAENLAPFFNILEFADSGVLDGVAVSGILDIGYSEQFGMSTHDARYTMAASATTAAATTASVLVARSVSYRVRSVQDDGTGVTVLLLERS